MPRLQMFFNVFTPCVLIGIYLCSNEVTSTNDPRLEPFLISKDKGAADKEPNGGLGINRMPDDCWMNCFQFASTPNELARFRIISRSYLQMYDKFMGMQQTNHVQQFVSQNAEYPMIQKRISSSDLFPGSILYLNDRQFITSLRRFSEFSKQSIVRGSRPSKNHDFVSILLHSESKVESNSLLLVITVDDNGLHHTRYYAEWGDNKKQGNVPGFDIHTLRGIFIPDCSHNVWQVKSEWGRSLHFFS